MRCFYILIFFITLHISGRCFSQIPDKINDSFDKLNDNSNITLKQIDSLLELSRSNKFSHPDRAMIYAQAALNLAEQENNKPRTLQAMLEIANVYIITTDYSEANALALNIKTIAQEEGLSSELANSYVILGGIDFLKGDITQSTENLFKALNIFEKTNNLEGLSSLYTNLGSILIIQGNYDKALEYYEISIGIAKKSGSEKILANILNNSGVIYGIKKDYTKAISYFNEALEIDEKINNIHGKAESLENLGKCYQELNDPKKAKQYFEEALAIYTKLGDFQKLAQCYCNFAEHYKKQNNDADFMHYAMLAYQEGKKYELKNTMYDATSMLHEFYRDKDKWDSAYKYVVIHNSIQDSIGMEESKARFASLEMQYQFKKKQQETEIQQQKKDYYIALFIFCLISGCIVIIIYLTRQRKKIKHIKLEKKQLVEEVEFKNKELIINVMNLLKKKEFIGEISNRLLEIEKEIQGQENKLKILNIANELQKNNEGEVWEDFETRFKQVHHSFYEQLLKSFPDLTSNELKLCALLRLNLSTKEIVKLTGQVPSSLEVARYRLRKKLKLTNSSINLVTFLSQY